MRSLHSLLNLSCITTSPALPQTGIHNVYLASTKVSQTLQNFSSEACSFSTCVSCAPPSMCDHQQNERVTNFHLNFGSLKPVPSFVHASVSSELSLQALPSVLPVNVARMPPVHYWLTIGVQTQIQIQGDLNTYFSDKMGEQSSQKHPDSGFRASVGPWTLH
eukprot:c27113_g2_i1 orf=348-833(-)